MSVTRVGAALGAEIRGIDLASPLDPDGVAGLRGAILDHHVVYLRDQPFSVSSIERLATDLGGLESTAILPGIDGHPGVVRVVKEPHELLNFGNQWHSDWSFKAAPPAFTILWAVDVPAAGGDTMWNNQELPLQRLSQEFMQHLRGLRAIHDSWHVFGPQGMFTQTAADRSMSFEAAEIPPQSGHPVIARHAETGRDAIFVNPTYTTRIEGWTVKESQGVLQHLYSMCQAHEYTFRLHWEPGTVAIWDNRSTWHLALNDYQGQRRELYRATVPRPPTDDREASESPPGKRDPGAED